MITVCQGRPWPHTKVLADPWLRHNLDELHNCQVEAGIRARVGVRLLPGGVYVPHGDGQEAGTLAAVQVYQTNEQTGVQTADMLV